MRLSPGQNVGPYEILLALGAGGMGEVYKARDTRLALAEMERAADERSPAVFWLMDDPSLDPVRRHPRFSAVLARIGLPERY